MELHFFESNLVIEEHATVKISNNTAVYSSGGCFSNCAITFKDDANAVFYGNKAGQSGGAIYAYNMCNITFKDNSTITFINNTARDDGGALVGSQLSTVIFEGNTAITFDNNTANNGGSFYLTNSTIMFTDSSVIWFFNNTAKKKGGAGYLDLNSNASFSQFTYLKFYGNKASYGRAILAIDHSNIIFSGKSVLLFASNRAAQYGGAVFLDIKTVMINNCNNKNY